ncbi:Antiviral helicase ski2 [Sporothrix epigloea]|uniref:Chromosome segregation in meiosis protein n=1 Tax=Sporothrix epigloea TaxID=1892477 RepID=A0ABP0E2Z8_9PEZI
MASTSVGRLPQRAAESFSDYIPDDFGDFGGLFSEDEQTGGGGKSTAAKSKQSEVDGTAGLGIDSEVSVKKRAREPRVKLDESRLLSEKGIPALRKQARVLKLKGKGHEFTDTSRLLSMYQLWLDDLFPKARFTDALAMVEKEGHKVGMHKMRTEWMNESRSSIPNDILEDTTFLHADKVIEPQKQQPVPVPDDNGDVMDSFPDDLFDDDLYDATPPPPSRSKRIQNAGLSNPDQVPDDDELDALMATAMEVHGPEELGPPAMPEPDDNFDELEALMAEAEAAG